MGFIPAQHSNSRGCRLINVIDDLNRADWTIDVDLSLPAARVIKPLNQIIKGMEN